MISPSRNGAWSKESLSTLSVSPWVRLMMIEKIMVVEPTTAVPISTGLAVALKVLPAPSFSSNNRFGTVPVGGEAEVAFDLLGDAGQGLDHRQARTPTARCR